LRRRMFGDFIMRLTVPKMDFFLKKDPSILKEERAFLMGESVQFGTPNSKKLREAVCDHYRKGQETLKGFVKWLIKTRGLQTKTAQNHTGRVWDALCFTFNEELDKSEPWKVLDDHRYNYATAQNYRSALRHWSTYTQDAELITELTLRSRRPKSMVIQPPKPGSIPYTKAEVKKLLRNIDKLREDPRYPWAYPILRIVILTGMSPIDIVWIDKVRLEMCFTNRTLEIWSKTRKAQKIPVDLIEDEIKMLLAIPWRWEIVADLIAPTQSNTKRVKQASALLRSRMQEVFAKAKIHKERQWIHRLRLTAARQYYKKSKSLVAAGQILGLRDINEVRSRLEG